MFTRHADPFTPLHQQLQHLMATLPIVSWDWNVDRYGAWVEWVCTENGHSQLYRLERRSDTLAPNPATAIDTGLDALQAIVSALQHVQALATLSLQPWTAWIAALHVSTSRRPVEPCFQVLGFTTRPTDPLAVRDRYRQLCQTAPADAQRSPLLEHYREAFDAALSLLTPSDPDRGDPSLSVRLPR